MKFIKLDNEPCDIGHIAIHSDFSVTPCGNWFIHDDYLIACPEEEVMRVLANAQECVDKIIRDLINWGRE
jgi:hypothetical protein